MKIAFFAAFLQLFSSSSGGQSFMVAEYRVSRGGVIIVQISPQWRAPYLSDSAISFLGENYRPDHNGRVVIGINLNTAPDKYTMTLVDYRRGVRLSQDYVEIEIEETVFLKTRMAAYTGRPGPRRDRQKRIIDRAFSPANKSLTDLTEGLPYFKPIIGPETIIDPFGFIYKNNDYKIHSGVDLRARVGTPVASVNKGLVVLAARRFRREGNMLIVNHGLGVFSVYMHLSKTYVKNGDVVERGQIIGLSGKTGAGVREPHLHFSIRVGDAYVDPIKFIDTINRYLER